MLSGRQWFSEKYSVLDPYGFVFYVWGAARAADVGAQELQRVQGAHDGTGGPARAQGREGQHLSGGARLVPALRFYCALTSPSGVNLSSSSLAGRQPVSHAFNLYR
jgi:hypothetical protein